MGARKVMPRDAEAARLRDEVSWLEARVAELEGELDRGKRQGSSRQHLRYALAAAQMVAWTWDPDVGLVTYVDNVADSPIGFIAQNQLQYYDMMHPADHARVRAAFERAYGESAEYHQEYRLLDPEGHVHWVASRGRPVIMPDGRRCMSGVIVDITDRKKVELALLDKEARLRVALEAGQLGDWDWDAATDILSLSARAAAILGYGTPIELPWSMLRMQLLPEDRDRLDEQIKRAFANNMDLTSEHRAVTCDGRMIWVSVQGRWRYGVDGKLDGVTGVIRDITEAKRADETLRAMTRRLDAVLNNATVAIFMMDERHNCVFMNAAAERLTGYTLPEVQSQSMHELVHHTRPDGSYYPSSECPISRAVAGHEQASGEEVFVHKEGHFYPVAFTTSPMRDEQDRLIGTVVEVRDITTERSATERQRFLMNELNHRVKNTLAIVQSIAAQSQRGATSIEEFISKFEGRLRALAAAHMLLTREGWQGASLEEVARQTLHPFDVDSRASPHFTIEGPHVRLGSDVAVNLSLALNELATNAVKYGALSMPAGRVLVQWRLVTGGERPAIELVWREAGGPPVSPPTRAGLGMRLIERGVTRELGGKAALMFKPNGVVCRLILPLSDKVRLD